MMFSNISLTSNAQSTAHPITDSRLPFADYLNRIHAIVESSHLSETATSGANLDKVINANCPYNLLPANVNPKTGKIHCGALLIHGLLDTPFTLLDLGLQLQSAGILGRSILLPGHGTSPADLLHVSYHEWIQAMRYGIESLRHEVDRIFLVGYSTGATLSVYQALQDSEVAGIILLSPAIKIKAPVDLAVAWYQFTQWLTRTRNPWMYQEPEIDYAKYQSIPFNAIKQVADLTKVIFELSHQHILTCPIYMAVSREDETISSHQAIDFFINQHNLDSRLLLYSSTEHRYPDQRITTRSSSFPDKNIIHCSHMALPFSPANSHYGEQGDYDYASHRQNKDVIYGAYNRIEQHFFDALYTAKMAAKRRRILTYNPDFDFMAQDIINFIKQRSA